MSLSIPFPFGCLLNKKAARVEVNISLTFLHRIGIALHPRPFVSDIAIFVLKGDVELQLTNCQLLVITVSLLVGTSVALNTHCGEL